MKYYMIWYNGVESILCYTEKLMDYDMLCNHKRTEPEKKLDVIIPSQGNKKASVRYIDLEDQSVHRNLNLNVHFN